MSALPTTQQPPPQAPPPPDPEKIKKQAEAATALARAKKEQAQAAAATAKAKQEAAPAVAPPTPAPPPGPPGLNAPPPAFTPPAPTAKYTAPTPETASYTAPQYKAPNKGLEYLSLALGLLFPGAPIGRAAAGFAQGLNQGAQQRYGRAEDTAKTQFEAARDKAAQDNATANAQASANFETARTADADTRADYTQNYKTRMDVYGQQQQDIRADVKAGKYFKPPPELTRVLPPGVKRPVNTRDYANHYAALAAAATQQGATDLAGRYQAEYKQYSTDADREDTSKQAWARTVYTQSQQNRRTEYVQGAENARTYAHIGAEWDMTTYRENREDYRALREKPGAAGRLQSEAAQAGVSFQNNWNKFTQPEYKTGPDGKPMLDPKTNQPIIRKAAPISEATGVRTAMTQVDKEMRAGGDPSRLADAMADFYMKTAGDASNNASAQVLRQYGEYRQKQMLANGRVPLPRPDSFYDRWKPEAIKVPPIDPAPFKAAGLDPADPKVRAEIKKFQDHGLPIDASAIDAIKKDVSPGGFHFSNPFTGGKVF